MLTHQSESRLWAARHPQAAKPRDVVISFQSMPPDLIEVTEAITGEKSHSRTVLREADVITELEKKYIFFADEAAIARKLIARGRSCVLSVYFREP
jgi:hypothetical protein